MRKYTTIYGVITKDAWDTVNNVMPLINIKISIHNNMCHDVRKANKKNCCLFSSESFLAWTNNKELDGSIIFSITAVIECVT